MTEALSVKHEIGVSPNCYAARRPPLSGRRWRQLSTTGSASTGPGAIATMSCSAIATKSARQCTEDLSAIFRQSAGSTPAWRATARRRPFIRSVRTSIPRRRAWACGERTKCTCRAPETPYRRGGDPDPSGNGDLPEAASAVQFGVRCLSYVISIPQSVIDVLVEPGCPAASVMAGSSYRHGPAPGLATGVHDAQPRTKPQPTPLIWDGTKIVKPRARTPVGDEVRPYDIAA